MNVGRTLKDGEKSGSVSIKETGEKWSQSSLVRLSCLLMRTSESDLQDIAMLISHPDISNLWSWKLFFFSNFDKEARENWTTADTKDEWCNWGVWLWNHVKWLEGLWLSGPSSHFNQEVRFHSKLCQWIISGNAVLRWGRNSTVTGKSHLSVRTKTWWMCSVSFSS